MSGPDTQNVSQNLSFWQVIGRAFGGQERVTELDGVPAGPVLGAGAVLLLLATGVSVVGFALWFPFYEEAAFLGTLPAMPLIFLAIYAGVSAWLRILGSRGQTDWARLFFAAAVGAFALSMGIVFGIAALKAFLGNTLGLALFVFFLMVGITWASVLMFQLWSWFLHISGGLASFFAGLTTVLALFAGILIWIQAFGMKYLVWDEMMFADF